jgi:hypothetical protein
MTSNSNPGCLAALVSLLRGERQPDSFPYRLRDDLLSAAELSFYHVLSTAVGSRATICVKIGLADVLYVSRPHENISARNRIDRKHIDFLLCDPATMKPLLAVELDDSSHQRRDRQARDEFVEKALQAAGLPLLRVPVRRQYDPREVAAQVESFLTGRAASRAAEAAMGSESDALAPLCPRCGIPMVQRTGTRGRHAGRQFYGCPNYPRCREIKPVAET